jgi:hypothetical protein
MRALPLHGSVEGNALWAMLTLGLADKRTEQMAERLRGGAVARWRVELHRTASGRSSQ